jgi:DNA repair photolyase
VDERGTKREFQEASSHPVERNIPKLQKLAHRSITNDCSLKDFEERVASLAEQIAHTEKVCL